MLFFWAELLESLSASESEDDSLEAVWSSGRTIGIATCVCLSLRAKKSSFKDIKNLRLLELTRLGFAAIGNPLSSDDDAVIRAPFWIPCVVIFCYTADIYNLFFFLNFSSIRMRDFWLILFLEIE